MNQFFNGMYHGFLYVIVRGDLPMYAALLLYYWGLTITGGFLGTISGGAHAISWAFVFTFALYVRLTIKYVIYAVGGNTWKEKIRNSIKANLGLIENMLVSALVACFAIGTTEFIWDVSFFIHQAIINGGYDIITFFEVSAIIGMSLSGTGMLIGFFVVRKQFFNQRKLLFAMSGIIAYHLFWIAIGFPYSTATNIYAHNPFVNGLEGGHWILGISGFWFAYKRPHK